MGSVTRSPAAALRALEALRTTFGNDAARRRLALLKALERARLPRARDVLRLHELLLFARAYPDDARVLAQAERMLARFARRADLHRHAAALESSGVAGTEIRFRFFAPTARWLAARWPKLLRIDWSEFDESARLEALLTLVAHFAETPGLDEYAYTPREWIERMKSRGEGDGAFLARAIGGLPMPDQARETLFDALDATMVLAPAADTPSRTLGIVRGARPVFVTRDLARGRPDLATELRRAPGAVRAFDRREGQRYVDLAREAMVTRQRDLDAFAYGDARDVRLVDSGDGLQFAVIGVIPERRLLLETVYGFLTLKNGVPIGYVLASSLFGSSELAFNVFDTFRGAEAGLVYARMSAAARHLFASDAFTIVPYQLGEGNDEALESGAWWFYQKMGFRPRARAARSLMSRELVAMRRRPSHRSSRTTLEQLAAHNVYFHLGAERADVIGEIPLANVGLQVTRMLAHRFGSDREGARRACADEAAKLLGVRAWRRLPAGERLAWERWAPLVLLLPGIERWPAADRRALVAVVRAKGGRRESDFTLAFDHHARLRRAIRALSERPI